MAVWPCDLLLQEDTVDKLQVIKLAEKEGGKPRREAIEKLIVYARQSGCNIEAGGGRVGGINIRFGGIGFAIMDISAEGDVKLYAQPHPRKTAPESVCNKINQFLEDRQDELKLKSHPINCHGLLTEKVENVSIGALIEFLEVSLGAVKETYYS